MSNSIVLQTILAIFCLSLTGYTATAKPHILNATIDFPTVENGDAPYYKDTRIRSLAINAQNPAYREKWAKAETRFSGADGVYTITITTLTEKDGESTYRLLVDGKEAGTFVNPPATKDYTSVAHTWSDIKLVSGSTIAIESISHTNGKIKARVGTQWSCGRWRSLTLVRID